MDVILDTNIYYHDFRMKGTHFQELFTYLRRADSSLVIPRVVMLESEKKYRDALSKPIKELRAAWDGMRAKAISNIGEFDDPVDIDAEVSLFKERLKQPAPKVKVQFYDDYSGVSVEEVVRRGVERVRPASEKGEELRDVILWLMVLDYAKKFQGKTAFISDDGEFHTPNGDLHEMLAGDIARNGVQVSYYRSISSFIQGNSLRTEVMNAELFFSFITSDSVEKEARESIERSREFRGAVQAVKIDTLRFSRGQRYEVEQNSFYVESLLTGTARVTVLEPRYITFSANTQLSPQVFRGIAKAQRRYDLYDRMADNTVAPGKVWYSTAAGIEPNGIINTTFSEMEPVEKLYRCYFELEVSARTDASKLIALQTDRLRVTEMEPIPDLGSLDFNVPSVE